MTCRVTSWPVREELHQVRAELSALLKRLPWSVEPLDGFSDDHGWRKVERPASPGWTADEQAEVEKLRQREHELAVFVSTHRSRFRASPAPSGWRPARS